MKSFRIEWIKIGRSKWSETVTKEFSTKFDAEVYAFEQADKQLMSSNTVLSSPDSKTGLYTISAGFHTVGHVKIYEVKQ